MNGTKKTACELDPERWFDAAAGDRKFAKAECGKCPVLDPCRELGWEHAHGTWGGLSSLDRKKLDPERYAASVLKSEAEANDRDAAIVGALNRIRLTIEP